MQIPHKQLLANAKNTYTLLYLIFYRILATQIGIFIRIEIILMAYEFLHIATP